MSRTPLQQHWKISVLVKLMLTKQKIFYPDKYTELTKNFLKNPKRILPTDIKLKGKQQVQKKTKFAASLHSLGHGPGWNSPNSRVLHAAGAVKEEGG